jgi:hydrogenase expression/formation protein HypE
MEITHAGSCPLPDRGSGDRVSLAHGEGGRLMRQLLRETLLPPLRNEFLTAMGDAADLPPLTGRVAMTTDSFVVSPLFFPGGDIGSLAVYGTVNDLAVSGACPRWLSLALILEEGLPMETLRQVLVSAAAAGRRVGVPIVCGDTKVVPRGAADGLFVNTTGVGEFLEPAWPGPAALRPGDQLIVSGPIGRHGMAVMTSREGLQFDPPPTSDSAPLVASVTALRSAGVPVRAIRDATRGGLAAVLHEWSEAAGLTMAVDEPNLPVTGDVRGACEVLGLDPIHVANEGTMLVAVPGEAARAALTALRTCDVSSRSVLIGRVEPRGPAAVVIHRALGGPLPLDEPAGAPLPRIC